MSSQGILPNPPTQAGFIEFLRTVVGINATILPDDSAVISYSYGSAYAITSCWLRCADPAYTYAVYNLATDILIQYARDADDAPIYQDGLPYFQYMREQFGVNSFVAGVVNSSSDEGTSQSLTVPDAFTGLTIGDLQNLKTPWGRTYLAWAQRIGTLWGLS